MWDPDGQDAIPGHTTATGIRSDTFDQSRSNGQTTVLSAQVQAVVSTMIDQTTTSGAEAQHLIDLGVIPTERLGFVIDTNGALTQQMATGVSQQNTDSTMTARAAVPAGAVAAVHGHIDGDTAQSSDGVLDDGASRGDTQSLSLRNPITTTTTSEGRQGVHEIVGGRLQFRMIEGTMTPHEQEQMQENLNNQQELFHADPPPPEPRG